MQLQNKQYQQLTLEPRYHISALREAGMTLREIGKRIGVHYSTISRELSRNKSSDGYDPKAAQQLSEHRKSHAEKANKKSDRLQDIIKTAIQLDWSPEALSQRLGVEGNAGDFLSHMTIYHRIEEDRQQGGNLYRLLPRFGKKRWKGGKRNNKAGVKHIPNRVDISQRPEIVDDRSRLGDWEGDTIHGQNAHLVTLVDRKTRFTLAKRVFSKTKEEVCDAMIEMLATVGAALTLTLDNGVEFADHQRLSDEIGIDVYFAKPYASWQRGTNENTNGRIRRFWPKKFDMANLSEQDIEDRIFLLNFTPRKVLNGLTPFEAFIGKRVALIT